MYLRDFDFDNKTISSKNFSYSSSGSVYKPLHFFYQHVVIDGEFPEEGDALVRSSTSMNPLGLYSQAGPVCYSDVYVYEGQNGEGGSTHYEYHNTPIPVSIDTRECQVPPVMDGLNGKLRQSEIRDNTGKVLKKNIYNYEMKHSDILKGVVMVHPYMDRSIYYENSIQIKFYDNISGRRRELFRQ